MRESKGNARENLCLILRTYYCLMKTIADTMEKD